MNRPLSWKKMALATTASLALLPLLSSCAWLLGTVSDEEVKQLDAEMSAPTTATSPLDEPLKAFARMLSAYGYNNVPVQSKNIGNETSEKGMPSDLYVMIATAMNKIGRPLVFIPYDTQYIVNEASTGGKISRIYPVAVIGGGITGYDKDLIEKEREGEVEGSYMNAQVSAKYNAAQGVSKISLDLNMTDYKTQSGVPGVLATNSINLRKDEFGWGVSAYYMGCGGSFDSLVKQKQGIHHACRILVDFSILELLGRYLEVPYWKCIPGANPDTEMIANLKEKFSSMPDSQQIALLKNYLALAGYDGLDLSSPNLGSAEQNVFRRAMTKFNAANHQDLFINVWQNINIEAAISRAKELRRAREAEARLAEAKAKLENEQNTAKAAAQYSQTMKNAEKLAESGDLAAARREFENAASLAPGEKGPAAKIAELDAKIAETAKRRDMELQALVQKTDALMQAGNLQAAKSAYSELLRTAPQHKHCSAKIAEIEAIEKQKAAEIENARSFIAEADRLFKAGELAKARELYAKALTTLADDPGIKAKMDEINKLLDKKAPVGIGRLKEEDF